MPPVFFLGDRLNGLEATIVEQDDGTTAVEMTTVGTTQVEFADAAMEHLLLFMLLELRRLSLGMAMIVGRELLDANDL